MHVAVISRPKAGATTVALEFSRLISEIRRGPLACHASEPSESAAFLAWGMEDFARGTRLGTVLAAIRNASEGAFLLATRGAVFSQCLEDFLDKLQGGREDAGMSRGSRTTPEVWSAVNRKMAGIIAACDEARSDLIEVHRRGATYINDPDFGRVEGEGVSARGEALAAQSAHLVVLVRGGLKDSSPTDTRSLHVLSDVSGATNGLTRPLPLIAGPRDRAALRRLISQAFREPLRNIAKLTDGDREAWRNIRLNEPADTWTEAQEMVERSEAKLLADKVRTLLAHYGLDRLDRDSKTAKRTALERLFKVGDIDLLETRPLSLLREGLAALPDYLRDLDGVAA